MNLSDVFNINDIFSPTIYYYGEWYLTRDIDHGNDHFQQNAKVVDGKNLYVEFLEKNYYKPMGDILASESLARALNPRIVMTDTYDSIRGANFSYEHLMVMLLQGQNSELTADVLDKIKDIDNKIEMEPFIKDLLRNERKKFSDVQKNGMQSQYYQIVNDEYKTYSRYGEELSFNQYIEARISAFTQLIFAFRYYYNFFKKPINSNELLECFNYDKFCLCAMYSVLETCYEFEKVDGRLNHCACHLGQYIQAIELLRKINPSYHCTILDKIDGKTVKLSVDDLIIKARELFARHPEFNIVLLDEEEAKGIMKTFNGDVDIDLASKDYEISLPVALTKLFEDRDIIASWEIIPNGDYSEDEMFERGVAGVPYYNAPLLEDEKIRRMLIAKNHLNSSPFLYSLKGINKFAGYIGYIYRNGRVVFEKFYEDEEHRTVASSNATYIMNLNNFIELSKLSKQKIINKIKHEGTKEVKRVYHGQDMEKWKTKIDQLIKGDTYTDEAVKYIELLIGQKIVAKSREQQL